MLVQKNLQISFYIIRRVITARVNEFTQKCLFLWLSVSFRIQPAMEEDALGVSSLTFLTF